MSVYRVILFIFYIAVSQCRMPDKVYCVNKDCSAPISKAKTLLNYNSADPDLISYRANQEAIVYMKSAGTNSDLWYAKINDKSGFVSSKFLRESKIIEKNLEFILPVDVTQRSIETPDVQPDKVKEAHEVFEGTTIYTTEPDISITTEAPIAVESSTLASYGESTLPTITQPDSTGVALENTVDQSEVHSVENNVEDVNNQDASTETSSTHKAEQNDEKKSDSVNNNKDQSDELAQHEKSQENFVDMSVSSENMEVPINLDVVQNTELPDSAENSESYISSVDNILNTSNEVTTAIPTTTTEIPNASNEIPNASAEIPNTSSELPSSSTEIPSATTEISSTKSENPLDSTESFINNKVSKQPAEQEPGLFDGLFSYDTREIDQSSENIIEPGHEKDSSEKTEQSSETSSNSETIPVTKEITDDVSQNLVTTDSKEDKASVQSTTEVPPVTLETVQTPVTENYPNVIENNQPVDQNQPQVLDNIPTTGIPAEIPYDQPPSYQPQIPPLYEPQVPPVYQPQVPTTDTLPPIFTTPEQALNNPTNTESTLHTEETTTTNYYDTYTTDAPPLEDTNSPTNDNSDTTPGDNASSEGFLSSMYSTIADVWPSTTEAPPSLFNTDSYQVDEQKIDGHAGFSFMRYLTSMYYSVMGVDEDIKALFPSHGETCYSDEYCDGKGDQSNRFLTFLITAASSVLLFTLGYYYIDNRRQDGQLIGQINSLQRDLLFSTKECEILKEELAATKTKLAGIEDSSFGIDDMVLSLKEEINELKATNERLRHSLDDNEKLLRVSENTAGELQNTLSEVENTLSELLAERANSEEQINELNVKIQVFEEELISVSRDRDNYQLKYVSAETALEESKKYKKQMEEINLQLTEAKNTIELQKHEISALKDVIHELKSGTAANGDATSLIDHTAIKAQLAKALEEKNSLSSRYEVEHAELKRLSEELQSTQEALRTASQQATEATTRLEVLGKYFQEREGELLKELSAKESLFLSKQGESVSTIEKIELMQQEVQRYKEKCDALTLELAEQETSRRNAVSEVESRAHDAWLEARAARREADAAKEEAATLRRKLASMTAASPHHKVASPIDMADPAALPPPLPLPFLPPPLLPPLPRPPPLGRLPSPHPPRYGDRRYSPESRYSPETVRYSPDSRYSPRRLDAYSPRSRRRSRDRYSEGRGSRTRNGPPDTEYTETEYNSDSPSRDPRRRRRYSRHSGSSGSGGYTSESDK